MLSRGGPSLVEGSPYLGYLYGYPHKTAYRALEPAERFESLWANERRERLFLYLHVPFCEMRCGFCNLFTQAQPSADLVEEYLGALGRQAARMRAALGAARFSRMAVGGGTPTLLDAGQLARLFDLAASLGARAAEVPTSVETSPETALPDRLAVLRERGVERVSIGVQTFLESEARSVARPQRTAEVEAALDRIRALGFPTLNIDLIYGMPEQTEATLVASLRAALRFRPEEIYLYPLYVRPLTALGKSTRSWDDQRLALYRAGRALLSGEGYEQVSMRMFRRPRSGPPSPPYRCQEDAMVGLGCGARSYTGAVHYSTEYAVGMRGVRAIVSDFVRRSDDELATARWGFRLDEDERRRRFAILSLLSDEGLDLTRFRARFSVEALAAIPEIGDLEPLGLSRREGDRIALTPSGIERSDAIGPFLVSPRVRALMAAWEAR